jgi:sugar lactone lactonase YvrE
VARSIRRAHCIPGGVAFSKDGKSAYALLNQNNTLAKVDLTKKPLKQGPQIRVGNAQQDVRRQDDQA